MPDYNYTRELVEGYWNVDARILSQEVVAALPDKTFRNRANGTALIFTFDVALTSPEETVLSDTTTAHKVAQLGRNLAICKRVKCQQLNARTEELLGEGFEYSSLHFSMDSSARIDIAQLNTERDDPLMPWNMAGELLYGALNDEGFLHITSSIEMHNFYLAGLDAYMALQSAANTLKEQVRALSTITEVNAFTDPR